MQAYSRAPVTCQPTQYIWRSNLPKESIPFSQALRLKRICSTITAFEDESAKPIKKIVEQGQKADDIKKILNRQVIPQKRNPTTRKPK